MSRASWPSAWRERHLEWRRVDLREQVARLHALALGEGHGEQRPVDARAHRHGAQRGHRAERGLDDVDVALARDGHGHRLDTAGIDATAGPRPCPRLSCPPPWWPWPRRGRHRATRVVHHQAPTATMRIAAKIAATTPRRRGLRGERGSGGAARGSCIGCPCSVWARALRPYCAVSTASPQRGFRHRLHRNVRSRIQ